MLQRFSLYLPHARRTVKIEVSIPSGYANSPVKYDALYLFDGQNVFKNGEASFGRSFHLGKYLSFMARRFSKRICGIAIWNEGSDLGRTNEYGPWKFDNDGGVYGNKQDPRKCKAFTKDFIHVIIPYIESHFPIAKGKEHTFVFGASLGALYAHYVANAYPDLFGGAGIFSNCPFLCEKSYYSFLSRHLNQDLRTYLYVGMQEYSDNRDVPENYFSAAKKLHKYLTKHQVPHRLALDLNGGHNEETWEKHILPFLMYLYFDDIDASV